MMKSTFTILAVIGVSLLAAFSIAPAAPQAAELPAAWQLDIQYHGPQAILVNVPGSNKPRLFWYMRYTVSNHTGEDQIFVPDFVLYTETGQILRAGQRVPTAVFDAIKKLYNDPLLKDSTDITGKLPQGEDNARSGVAIWPDFDPRAGSFDIFVGGLSGETAEVVLPQPIHVQDTDPLTGAKRTVTKDRMVLSRTLDLRYFIPGEASARATAPVKLLEQRWVIR